MSESTMYKIEICIFLSLICINCALCDGGPRDVKNMKIDLASAKLSSQNSPDLLKCDTCSAIAYQINKAFHKATKDITKKLRESDTIEVLEKTCAKDYTEYGLKVVDNTNRLSGPGTYANDVDGMMQMGGQWPKTLKDTCSFYVGELDEYVLYEMFLKYNGNILKYLCHGSGIRNSCSIVKKTEL